MSDFEHILFSNINEEFVFTAGDVIARAGVA
jgi:hypothetical protein